MMIGWLNSYKHNITYEGSPLVLNVQQLQYATSDTFVNR